MHDRENFDLSNFQLRIGVLAAGDRPDWPWQRDTLVNVFSVVFGCL
jgi:hypothetical protein